MASRTTATRVSELLNELQQLIGGGSSTLTTASHEPVPTPHRIVPSQAVQQERAGPSTSAVLTELRGRFAPYPGQGNRIQATARPAQRRSGRQNITQSRMWSHQFYCLGGPRDVNTPSEIRKVLLSEAGLGWSVITSLGSASAAQLQDNICDTFSKLQGVAFELLRTTGAGRNRPLIRISPTDLIPSVDYLKASRVALIYIRPMSNIEFEDESERDDETSQESEAEPNVDDEGSTEEQANRTTTHVPDIDTIETFRSQLYRDNPGQQCIYVSTRENFLEQILGVYKDRHFNMLMKPKVHFNGEPGSDIGALSREYFWKGLLAITDEKFDGKTLFEGEVDHRLPVPDSKLLRSGVFRTLGKFVAHAILHCGIGVIGLSEAAVEYLTTEELDADTPFTITLDDIPDFDMRGTITEIQKLTSGATLTEEKREEISMLASSSDWHDPITTINAAQAIDAILYHQVIERRKSYLDAVKEGLRATGLLQFLSSKQFLRSGAFPRANSINYPPELIISRIECDGSDEIFTFVKAFILNLCKHYSYSRIQPKRSAALHEYICDIFVIAPEKIQQLLCAWTGWPVIPESNLKIKVESDCDFAIHTCFQEIEIPYGFSQDDIDLHFNMSIEFASAGFGST